MNVGAGRLADAASSASVDAVAQSDEALEGVTAVREAIARGRSRFLSLARAWAGADIDAEEALHAAFEKALSSADRLRDPASAEAWVGRVVRNTVVDALRRRRSVVAEVDPVEIADPIERTSNCECVLHEARHLKPEYAAILERVVVEGVSVGEVASELGLTANNASVRLHRAREALRRRVVAHCGTESATGCGDCLCETRGCCAA